MYKQQKMEKKGDRKVSEQKEEKHFSPPHSFPPSILHKCIMLEQVCLIIITIKSKQITIQSWNSG